MRTPPNTFVFTLSALGLSSVADFGQADSPRLAAGMFGAASTSLEAIETNSSLPIVAIVQGQGVLSRWNAASGRWEALPSSNNSDNTVTSVLNEVGDTTLFRMLVPDGQPAAADFDIPNGHFYGEANGFGGAGGTGYSILDDQSASLWSEFQRLGGIQRVGYPVTNRFMHRGFLTQAFQKMVLQWRPELNASVPVNVLDDMSVRGVDGFIDAFRQVPAPADTGADAGLPWDKVVERHVGHPGPVPGNKGLRSVQPQLAGDLRIAPLRPGIRPVRDRQTPESHSPVVEAGHAMGEGWHSGGRKRRRSGEGIRAVAPSSDFTRQEVRELRPAYRQAARAEPGQWVPRLCGTFGSRAFVS